MHCGVKCTKIQKCAIFGLLAIFSLLNGTFFDEIYAKIQLKRLYIKHNLIRLNSLLHFS